MVDAALDALRGEDKFKGSPVAVRTLMVLYPNRMHVVYDRGPGVTKISDLKGKRVSTGSPGSATEVMAFRVIEARGPDKRQGHEARAARGRRVGERAQGPEDRRLLLGRRSADRRRHRLGSTPNVKTEMIDHAEVVDKMNAQYGGIYSSGVIPAKTYPGQTTDNAIAVVQNILVANANMPDKVAYDIVKTSSSGRRNWSRCTARPRVSRWKISSARARRSRGIPARSAIWSSAA